MPHSALFEQNNIFSNSLNYDSLKNLSGSFQRGILEKKNLSRPLFLDRLTKKFVSPQANSRSLLLKPVKEDLSFKSR
jgi:hypothetical protein